MHSEKGLVVEIHPDFECASKDSGLQKETMSAPQ